MKQWVDCSVIEITVTTNNQQVGLSAAEVVKGSTDTGQRIGQPAPEGQSWNRCLGGREQRAASACDPPRTETNESGMKWGPHEWMTFQFALGVSSCCLWSGASDDLGLICRGIHCRRSAQPWVTKTGAAWSSRLLGLLSQRWRPQRRWSRAALVRPGASEALRPGITGDYRCMTGTGIPSDCGLLCVCVRMSYCTHTCGWLHGCMHLCTSCLCLLVCSTAVFPVLIFSNIPSSSDCKLKSWD